MSAPGTGNNQPASPLPSGVPTNTLQYSFRDHFGGFAAHYESRYVKELGNFRIERISQVGIRFLSCGDCPLGDSGGPPRLRVHGRVWRCAAERHTLYYHARLEEA